MKKNIFSKISVMVLLFCSIVVMSACSVFQKDGVNITGIEVIDETVPTYILAKEGAFDEAGIKIKVSYSDGDSKDIAVTTEMIPEEYQDELLTPGEYDITILFKGKEATLHIKIAEVANVYTVRFYNGLNNLISVQEVKEGEDAIEPNAGLYAVEGYEFMGWDRAIINVTEDMDVNATYIKVESTLTEEVLEEKFFNAINNTMTTSHTSSVQDLGDEGWEELYLNNFHYESETDIIELQTKNYCAGEVCMYQEAKNGYISQWISDDSSENFVYGQVGENSLIYLSADIYTTEEVNKLIQDENCESVEYSYLIAGNKTTYYCTITYENLEYIFSYDDNAIISWKEYNREKLSMQADYVYSETEVPFEDWSEIFTEEPEEVIINAKSELLEVYNNTINSDFVATDNSSTQGYSIKYDKDNKVSAKINKDGSLLNVNWVDTNTCNSYDGVVYSTIDNILSFIPNIDEILNSGKFEGKDVSYAIQISISSNGKKETGIWIETEEEDIMILFSEDKIVRFYTSTMQYDYDASFIFTYEAVELVLPDDIKNKTEGAELKLN